MTVKSLVGSTFSLAAVRSLTATDSLSRGFKAERTLVQPRLQANKLPRLRDDLRSSPSGTHQRSPSSVTKGKHYRFATRPTIDSATIIEPLFAIAAAADAEGNRDYIPRR